MTPAWNRGVIRGPIGRVDDQASWIVKFGGSLLARPRWPDELRVLLAEVPGPATVVVGGGAMVDGLRSIDQANPRPAELMHRLAIDAMGLTARLVADAIGWSVNAEPARTGMPVVLDAPAWLGRGGRLSALPAGWHVTSDSIAAVVAASCAAQLLLAKSVAPPCPAPRLVDLSAAGWVDRQFPVAALPVAVIHWAAPAKGLEAAS
ncbi:MAG: hypothetical protein K8S94_09730 [Planctomycetia bacterium]|nr:hypothetical protein [Planctomycetia bacterium]